MSYKQEIFIDNCVMRLVQLKRAICQRIDAEERVEDLTLERERQEFDCQNSDRLIMVDGHMWRE